MIGTVLNEHHALASAANFTAGMAAGYRILARVLAVATMCAQIRARVLRSPNGSGTRQLSIDCQRGDTFGRTAVAGAQKAARDRTGQVRCPSDRW